MPSRGLDLDRSHVKAPFDGVVAERIASPGDYLAVGAPIARLVQTDPLRLRLEVPERESVAVRAGQSVRVSVEGDTNIYRGQFAASRPPSARTIACCWSRLTCRIPAGCARDSLPARPSSSTNAKKP
jgi:membrane fusion protein (multidrug efflux system)